jgi:hypothetical protein
MILSSDDVECGQQTHEGANEQKEAAKSEPKNKQQAFITINQHSGRLFHTKKMCV